MNIGPTVLLKSSSTSLHDSESSNVDMKPLPNGIRSSCLSVSSPNRIPSLFANCSIHLITSNMAAEFSSEEDQLTKSIDHKSDVKQTNKYSFYDSKSECDTVLQTSSPQVCSTQHRLPPLGRSESSEAGLNIQSDQLNPLEDSSNQLVSDDQFDKSSSNNRPTEETDFPSGNCTIGNFLPKPNNLCQQCKVRLRDIENCSQESNSKCKINPGQRTDSKNLLHCSNSCPFNAVNISPKTDIPLIDLTHNTNQNLIPIPSLSLTAQCQSQCSPDHSNSHENENSTLKSLRFSQFDKITAAEIYTQPGIVPLDALFYSKSRNSLDTSRMGPSPCKMDRSMSESPKQSIPRTLLGFSLSYNSSNRITNKFPNTKDPHQDSSRTSISEATVKVIGDGQARDLNKRSTSVPTGSANICRPSVTIPLKRDSLDDESLMIMDGKRSAGGAGNEINAVNTVLSRRSLRSSNAGQALNEPPSRTCCFCWCCCCSCSCMRIRPNLNESKRPSASNDPHSVLDALNIDEKIDLEEVHKWAESFDELMQSSAGRKMFREFLRSEYSEENILFWLACEELKKETNLEILEEKARLIYEDFISILSPREVSLDSRVRELINANMIEPTPRIFDEAQLQIYTLMHRDSYPRFLNSRLYKDLLQEIKDMQT